MSTKVIAFGHPAVEIANTQAALHRKASNTVCIVLSGILITGLHNTLKSADTRILPRQNIGTKQNKLYILSKFTLLVTRQRLDM